MPNGQNRPPAPEQAESRQPDVPADAVEHHVYLADRVADLPLPAVAPVVGGQVGAQVPGQGELARVAGQGYDPGSGVAGDLHQQRAHATPRGLDQDGLACLQVGPACQGERCPAVGQQRDGIPYSQHVRDFDQPRRRGDRTFGVSARPVQAGHNPPASAGHRAAHAVAQDGRQRREHRLWRRPRP